MKTPKVTSLEVAQLARVSQATAARAAKHGDVWELALAPGGGQAIRFIAAGSAAAR